MTPYPNQAFPAQTCLHTLPLGSRPYTGPHLPMPPACTDPETAPSYSPYSSQTPAGSPTVSVSETCQAANSIQWGLADPSTKRLSRHCYSPPSDETLPCLQWPS